MESQFATKLDMTSFQTGIESRFRDLEVKWVSGKGLSTNDFTNEYKAKLDGLVNYELTSAKVVSALGYTPYE